MDALFPSIYLSYPDLHSNLIALTGRLTEAKRVSALSTPPKLVYAYTMTEFDDDAWNHTALEITFLPRSSNCEHASAKHATVPIPAGLV